MEKFVVIDPDFVGKRGGKSIMVISLTFRSGEICFEIVLSPGITPQQIDAHNFYFFFGFRLFNNNNKT